MSTTQNSNSSPIQPTSNNFTIKANPKTQWFSQLWLIVMFQSVFYGSIALCLYALFTLNLHLLLFLLMVIIVQRAAIKKSPTIIKLVNQIVHPLHYYNSFSRIYDEPINQEEPSLFCFHPHSILPYCYLGNMNADNSKMSRMTGLASRFILNIPFTGIELRWWGIQSVNGRNMKKLMSEKKDIGVIPGGFEEATLTSTKQIRLYLKNRKGFLKYALEYGYTVYPVLVYNEHKAFSTFDHFANFRLLLNKLKFPGVLFGGGFLWLYLPLNLDMVTIVGRGLKRNESSLKQPVTSEEVDEIHLKYIEEIQRVHEKYREQYQEAPLVIY